MQQPHLQQQQWQMQQQQWQLQQQPVCDDAAPDKPQYHALISRCLRCQCSRSQLQAFLLKWFLPLAFAVGLIIGLSWAWPGATISAWSVSEYRIIQTINVMTVFVISGLNLKSADIKSALSRQGSMGFLVGMVSATPATCVPSALASKRFMLCSMTISLCRRVCVVQVRAQLP
jgi:hypothetical protein